MQDTAVEEKGRQDERLGNAPLGRLMVSMALPAVAAQLINMLYNIVDRIYIGHIPGQGDVALTGVGVTFPIIMLVSAFSAFAGMGGAPLASIELGKKEYGRAERILGSSAGLILIFSVVLTLVFSLFKTPILYAFGASEATIGYAESYIGIYLAGTIFVQTALGLNTFISGQGASKTAMLSVLIGAVLNICLDPVFIFLFGMGVRGAALATVISQAVSAVWVVRFLTSEKSVIKLKTGNIKPEAETVKMIAALGISPFIMRATESFISIVLNRGLQAYGGDLHVGALTIMQSVMQLFSAPVGGFTQGMTPIVSYNYGAGNFDRVKQLYRWMIGLCFGFMFVSTVTTMIFPEFYAGFFTNETALAELVGRVMPVFMAGMLVFGLQNGIQPTFLALGQAKVSLFIAVLRKIILLIPLAIILPHFFGVMGVYYAEPISDIISATTASALFLVNIKKILSAESLAKIR